MMHDFVTSDEKLNFSVLGFASVGQLTTKYEKNSTFHHSQYTCLPQ